MIQVKYGWNVLFYLTLDQNNSVYFAGNKVQYIKKRFLNDTKLLE